jgi:hypothetical protein
MLQRLTHLFRPARRASSGGSPVLGAQVFGGMRGRGWGAAAVSAVGVLWGGCGAQPAPRQALAPTWGELTAEVGGEGVGGSVGGGARGRLSFELWSREAERPSLKEVEERLASASVLASLNSTAGGMRAEVGEARCEVSWQEAPAPERGERVAMCAPSLEGSLGALLGSAGGLARVECEVGGLDAAVDARSVSVGLAKGRESVWVLPSAGLCGAPVKVGAFETPDVVSVRALRAAGGPEGQVSLCTQGMGAFGRAELCFVGVREEREGVAREALVAIADEGLRGAPLVAGSKVSRGPASGLLTSARVVAERLEALRAPLASAPEGALVLTPQEGRSDDLEGLTRLMMRFTVGG